MRISTKGRYALTIMLDIGSKYYDDKFVSLSEISEKENISIKYLEKIMLDLNKHDFFISTRGKDGGYKLKYPPENYKIGDIIKAAEEKIEITSCIKDNCPKKGKCRSYPLWEGLSNEINEYLNSKTLKDYL